ncbi:MAG: hypothetical protein HW399_462 [Dehalococcoidia bacterium]|nr:hypothetical protein [Dehalococcoidia bacterium]
MAKNNASQIKTDSDIEMLKDRITTFCAQTGYQLSPQADAIINDIVNMKRLTGDYFCPCQPQRLPETVCVCQAVRNGLVNMLGACFCNLILSNNKDEE